MNLLVETKEEHVITTLGLSGTRFK